MKKVLMFHFAACPYCAAARKWLQEIQREHPELARVPVEMVDERLEPERADAYDYWSVPTFYIDGEKVHEGAATKAIVEGVLRKAAEK